MKHAMMQTVFALTLAYAGAVKAEMVNVVEITDLQKKATYEVMSSSELKTLQKTIEAEKNVFPKALELVRKDWETADKTPVEKPAAGAKPAEKEKPAALLPFPTGMLAPRKAVVKGEFSDAQKAAKQRDKLDNAQIEAPVKEPKKGGTGKGGTLTEKDKQKMAREHDRELAADRAATMLQSKIDELIKNAAAAASGAAAAPAAGGTDKPADAPTKAAQPNAGDQAKPAGGAK